MNNLGALLKHYIHYNGLTQKFVANKLKVSPANLSKIIAGKQKPTAPLTFKILDLVMPPEYKTLMLQVEAEAECYLHRIEFNK